jgi:hypothetical protein
MHRKNLGSFSTLNSPKWTILQIRMSLSVRLKRLMAFWSSLRLSAAMSFRVNDDLIDDIGLIGSDP